MKRIALRAEYRTDDIFNEGYICIQENDDKTRTIEGVFGLDYVKIDFVKEDAFELKLMQFFSYTKQNYPLYLPTITVFTSQILYNPELYCPEQYLLFASKNRGMSLSLLEKVKDEAQVKEIYEYLVQLRP